MLRGSSADSDGSAAGSDGTVLHPAVFPYPVPPIEENILDEDKLLKAWDAKKVLFSSPLKLDPVGPEQNLVDHPEPQVSAVLFLLFFFCVSECLCFPSSCLCRRLDQSPVRFQASSKSWF